VTGHFNVRGGIDFVMSRRAISKRVKTSSQLGYPVIISGDD
jgi:hypothetical protein